MCGIVGILGNHEVGPLLVNALKRLEYRGYDSAGIATLNDGKLGRRRSLGKLAELSDLLVRDPIQGKSGIGHTRWATHGKPSVNNAHPHMTEQVAVVHNGIIENFQELRKYLEKKGIKHTTDTDTETIALLTQAMIEEGNEPIEAAQKTIEKLTGGDSGREKRQLAAIDKKGEPFGFTGADSVPFSGHLVGENYIVAGNMLSNPSVLSAMGDCINKCYSSEAEKMLAILQAGQRAGGDKRGIQSAAMLILDPEKPPLDLRVDYDENPIFALEELWKRSQRPPYSSWLDEVPILSDKNRSDMPQKNTGT